MSTKKRPAESGDHGQGAANLVWDDEKMKTFIADFGRQHSALSDPKSFALAEPAAQQIVEWAESVRERGRVLDEKWIFLVYDGMSRSTSRAWKDAKNKHRVRMEEAANFFASNADPQSDVQNCERNLKRWSIDANSAFVYVSCSTFYDAVQETSRSAFSDQTKWEAFAKHAALIQAPPNNELSPLAGAFFALHVLNKASESTLDKRFWSTVVKQVGKMTRRVESAMLMLADIAWIKLCIFVRCGYHRRMVEEGPIRIGFEVLKAELARFRSLKRGYWQLAALTQKALSKHKDDFDLHVAMGEVARKFIAADGESDRVKSERKSNELGKAVVDLLLSSASIPDGEKANEFNGLFESFFPRTKSANDDLNQLVKQVEKSLSVSSSSSSTEIRIGSVRTSPPLDAREEASRTESIVLEALFSEYERVTGLPADRPPAKEEKKTAEENGDEEDFTFVDESVQVM